MHNECSYLGHPLQHGLQPVDVALAVGVQEGEDGGPRGVRPPHPGPHQPCGDGFVSGGKQSHSVTQVR